MTFHFLLARLLPLLLLLPLMNAHAADTAAQAEPGRADPGRADPKVWGVYAQLVGHRFKGPTDRWPGYEIVWSKPGEEIRETKRWFNTGEVEWTRLVRPGARAGALVATGTGEYHKTAQDWIGTVGADGSVSFALQNGLLKAPYRVIAMNGGLKFEQNGAPPFAFTAEALPPAATVAAQTPATAPGAAPAHGWGALERLAGKSWRLHNSGRWESDTTLLTYQWSADRRALTLSTGDGYSARQTGAYHLDPATGQLTADVQDEDGRPVRAPAQVDGSGAVTVQLSDKRRSITAIDSDSSALKKTLQKLSWGGGWKDIETLWYFDAAPGPEWGVFSKLVGYNWDLNGVWSIHFRWLPQSQKVEAGIYRSYDLEAVVEITRRADHPQQFIANGEGVKGILDGGTTGLVVLEGADKATQVSGKNRHTYELLPHPDRLVIYSQRWVDGELKPLNNIYTREDQARKNERIAGIKRYHEARAASERTDRWLAASAALGGALQAANEVAAARVAQSQAELDATLDTLAEQAQYERMEAAAQQAAAEEAARQRAQEREQDAIVAAAMAQVRQLAREAGDEAALDRAIAETNRAIDQQEEARKQRIAEQEREARLNAQQQMKQFVQSSQAAQAQQARPQSTPEPAATATTTGSAASVYMGCVSINSTNKVAYLSDIARIPMAGEQDRWNAVFFTQHVARTQNLPERDFQNHCYIDRNGEAGASNKREQNRKTYTDYGFSIVELDWSPEQRY